MILTLLTLIWCFEELLGRIYVFWKGELEILKSQIVISNVADNQDDSNWKSQIATSNFVRMALRKLDIEDILHDQNDINESTRMQLENITLALSELQAKEPKAKPRRRIGFIQI